MMKAAKFMKYSKKLANNSNFHVILQLLIHA